MMPRHVSPDDPAGPRCRLCHGQLESQFDLTVLGRHQVGYWRCCACGSLQTDEPHWLTEAYSTSLTVSDVGAVRRCLTCRAAVWLILRFLHMRKVRLLDFGGGSGLLCRLLRDIGIDAWTFDAYGSSEYARSFGVDPAAVAPGSFQVVTAFEIFEHLPCPDKDLAGLFRLSPQALIASTEPVRADYDKSWWYLAPHTGQHVFFYSQRALQVIADRFGYSLQSVGGWHIFTRRPVRPAVSRLVRLALSAKSLRTCRVIMEAMRNDDYVMRDYQLSLGTAMKPDTTVARRHPETELDGHPEISQ
jgi:Methyltransferase domain